MTSFIIWNKRRPSRGTETIPVGIPCFRWCTLHSVQNNWGQEGNTLHNFPLTMSSQNRNLSKHSEVRVASLDTLRQTLPYIQSLHAAHEVTKKIKHPQCQVSASRCLRMPIHLLWLYGKRGSSTQELPDKWTAKCEAKNVHLQFALDWLQAPISLVLSLQVIKVMTPLLQLGERRWPTHHTRCMEKEANHVDYRSWWFFMQEQQRNH